jgi:hypothetical protein
MIVVGACDATGSRNPTEAVGGKLQQGARGAEERQTLTSAQIMCIWPPIDNGSNGWGALRR